MSCIISIFIKKINGFNSDYDTLSIGWFCYICGELLLIIVLIVNVCFDKSSLTYVRVVHNPHKTTLQKSYFNQINYIIWKNIEIYGANTT